MKPRNAGKAHKEWLAKREEAQKVHAEAEARQRAEEVKRMEARKANAT